MGELKSARELALERIAKMNSAREADPAAKLRWEFEPKGQEIAGQFLNSDNKEKMDLNAELMAITDEEGRQVAKKAMTTVFLNYIVLVDTLHEKRQVERALTGLREIKEDKEGFDLINNDLMEIYRHNAAQGQEKRKQMKEALTQSYMQQLEQLKQQGMQIDMQQMAPDNSPEFQQQYRYYLNEIDNGYKTGIEECKQRLAALS